jgi:hypothetical protein
MVPLGRLDLIRSPKRVLAHLWRDLSYEMPQNEKIVIKLKK